MHRRKAAYTRRSASSRGSVRNCASAKTSATAVGCWICLSNRRRACEKRHPQQFRFHDLSPFVLQYLLSFLFNSVHQQLVAFSPVIHFASSEAEEDRSRGYVGGLAG